MDLLPEISRPFRADDKSFLRIDGKGIWMPLDVHSLAIPDVKLIRTPRFSDARGYFCETFQRADFAARGLDNDFVQDNQSRSDRSGTVRGLHFQRPPFAQTKLVRVLRGRIFDVAVDLRRSSPSFGRHVAVELSSEGDEQLLVPAGFAHGFCTLEPDTVVFYKVDQVYSVENSLMRVLVTGGAGFIGSAVCRRLVLGHGTAVVNIDKLTYAANLRSLDSLAGEPAYAFEHLDICNRAGLDRVFAKYEPDALIHLAAESHVDRSITGPSTFIDTNIVGTYNLLEAARKYYDHLTPERRSRFRFVHVSTDISRMLGSRHMTCQSSSRIVRTITVRTNFQRNSFH